MAQARAQFRIDADDRASRSLRDVQRRFQDLATSAAVLQGPLGGVAGRLSSIGAGLGRIGPVGLAAGLGFTALTAGLLSASREGSKLESQQGRLAAVLKATGGSAGVSLAEIEAMSRELGIATLASAEGARDAAAVLLTFKSITGDAFERTLKLSQDLAEVMGSDLKSSALQVAKALEDPVRGITALRRSGVSFTRTQQDMIKSMMDAGRQAEAQGLILDTLQAQVGGAGAGATKGLAGSVDSLKEEWTQLLQELNQSTGASDIAKTALDKIADGIRNVREASEGRRTADPESLEARRVSMTQTIAALEAQIAESQNSGPIAGKMLQRELDEARKRFAALRVEIEVADEFDGMVAAMKEVNAQAKKDADQAAAAAAQDEARITLMQKYEEKLHDVRKALGSSTIKAQEQQAQLGLLQFAYEQGAIGLEEFIELQEKLTEEKRKAQQAGEIEMFSRFAAPGMEAASGVRAGSLSEQIKQAEAATAAARKDFLAAAPIKPVATEVDKDSLKTLQRIERHLANGGTVAVTI